MPPARALRGCLSQELRRRPFRPLLIEDLKLMDPRIEPAEIIIPKDCYRTLYENAFVFTRGILTPFEVGFFLENGGVKPHRQFRMYRGVVGMLLDNGLAEVHADACKSWEALSRGRFDPNDQENALEHGWPELIEPPAEIENLLSPNDRMVLGYAGVFPFFYHDGFAACCIVPDAEGAMHTHTIIHSQPDVYFPSDYDGASPAIWLVLDTAFIKDTLAGSLSLEEKARVIIDHHVDGMARAVCVGSKMDETGLKALVNKER